MIIEYLCKFDEDIMNSALKNISVSQFNYLCKRILEIMENDYSVDVSKLITDIKNERK